MSHGNTALDLEPDIIPEYRSEELGICTGNPWILLSVSILVLTNIRTHQSTDILCSHRSRIHEYGFYKDLSTVYPWIYSYATLCNGIPIVTQKILPIHYIRHPRCSIEVIILDKT